MGHARFGVCGWLGMALRVISCFFPAAGPHRHLHSFPTRRSSDLSPPGCWRGGTGAGRRPPRARASPVGTRSEEHTSELQSPYELVCRLLLEKKKAAGTAELPAASAPAAPGSAGLTARPQWVPEPS